MSSPSSSTARDEQLAAILAVPPPRPLPRGLRGAALRQAAPLSFGVFGALFGGFGLLIAWVFFPWHIAGDWRLLATDTAQASGVIRASANTRLHLKNEPVVHYAFEFHTAAGTARRGECYTTGQQWQNGDLVQVRYRPEEPSIACPVGARLGPTGTNSLFVALFPLGGASLVLWVAVSRRRMLHTFVNGRVLEVVITDIEHTQTMHNDYPVIKITFERVDARRDPPIILRYWKPKVVAFLQLRKENGQPVFLLNNLQKPSSYFLPEML